MKKLRHVRYCTSLEVQNHRRNNVDRDAQYIRKWSWFNGRVVTPTPLVLILNLMCVHMTHSVYASIIPTTDKLWKRKQDAVTRFASHVVCSVVSEPRSDKILTQMSMLMDRICIIYRNVCNKYSHPRILQKVETYTLEMLSSQLFTEAFPDLCSLNPFGSHSRLKAHPTFMA